MSNRCLSRFFYHKILGIWWRINWNFLDNCFIKLTSWFIFYLIKFGLGCSRKFRFRDVSFLLKNEKTTFCPEFLTDQKFVFSKMLIIWNDTALWLVENRLSPIIQIKPSFCTSHLNEFHYINFHIKNVLRGLWV